MDPNQINQNPMGVPVDPMAPQMPADQPQPAVDPMPQAPMDQPQPVVPVSDPGMQTPVEPTMPEPTAPVEPVAPEVPTVPPMPEPEVPVTPVIEEQPVAPVEQTPVQGGDMGGGQMPPTTPTV